MDVMKLFLISVLLLSHAFCGEMEADTWKESMGEVNWPDSGLLEEVLVRLTRKPGPRQYLGLMGKKESGKTQTARKRHKFQTFVGLMGKRSFEDEGALDLMED